MTKTEERSDFALITGASEGIGRAIAAELASRKINLILVALPDAKLQKAACELKKTYGVEVVTYATDLIKEGAVQALFQWCSDHQYLVNILVNNAGIGHEGAFETTPLSYIDDMMQLNMRSVIHLTYLFVPHLKKNREAYILNVGSLASFRPMPYKNIYTATKSFIFYFTRALREELKGSSIKVSVLCPVPTNSKVKARTTSKGIIGKMMILTAEKVAKIGIEKLYKGQAVIVPGFINKSLLIFEKTLPRNIPMKILASMYKDS